MIIAKINDYLARKRNEKNIRRYAERFGIDRKEINVIPVYSHPCFTLNEYERMAMLTDCEHSDAMDGLVNAMFGLMGEVGEYADIIKKHTWQGHKELDKIHLLKEHGDIMWYCAQLAYYEAQLFEDPDITLGLVGEMNIEKLEKRYSSGKFEVEKSLKRAAGDI